jgi:soluble lytic murein transglycosylase-like protein
MQLLFNCYATYLAHPLLTRSLMMKTRLLLALLFIVFLNAGAMAQSRSAREQSLTERAREIEPLIIEASNRYRIDPRLLRGICFAESRYRANAISPKGALGLMQFMPETAARYGLTNPFDPKAAIDAGARYLRDLQARFHGRMDLAVAAYNAGEGAVESFLTGKPLVMKTGKVINARGLATGGIPPYPETRAYVRSVVGPLLNNRVVSTTRALPSTATNSIADETRQQSLNSSSFIEVP